jgi:uncharacterized glyoxalase superfamily protein PhnB
MSDTTTTVNTPTVWPALTYKDAEAALRFLKEAFGFEGTLVVRGEEGDGRAIHHAEMKWPLGGGIMFGSPRPVGDDDPFPSGPVSLYVVCDDPDGLLERVTKAGAEVILPIKDEDYGSRGFTVRDPEGNVWTFGTYRGA